MKFTTPKDNFAKALATVNLSISNRTSLPITLNVLIEAQEDRINLSGTNLITHISTSFPAAVTEPGVVTIPARLITEFVASLPSEPITVEVPLGSNIAHLTCGKAQAHINGASANEFPPTPEVSPDATISLKPSVLKKAISRTAFCAAPDDTRPILNGIYMKFSGDTFTMAAADGFRLSVNQHVLETPVEQDTDAVVPVRTFQTLARILPDSEEPVEIRLSKLTGQALFSLNETKLTSQLLSGTYPNYEQLIPDSTSTKSTFNTKELMQATKTASIFADQGSNIIRFMINGEDTPEEDRTALVSAEAEQVGDNMDKVIPISTEGPDAKVAINARYIREALAAIDPDPVLIEISTPTSPAVLKPVNPDDSFIQVVMPMFIQW